MAVSPRPTAQPAGTHHLAVGDLLVTAINDGMFTGSLDFIVNIGASEAERLQRAAFRPVPPPLTVNAFLVRRDDALVLVDTGCGTSMGPTLGSLRAHLRALGIEPATIGAILLTHLHPDHANGLVDDAGAALFPNAEIVVHAEELDFWHRDNLPEPAVSYVAGARAAVAPYRDRIRVVRGGEALPGITAVEEPGHTPGHTGWMVQSGSEELLIWGDIVHMPGIQFANPDAGMGFDVDRAQAVATRRRIMDMAATDGLLVAGMHLEFPAFGRLTRAGGGYAFVPELWRSAI